MKKLLLLAWFTLLLSGCANPTQKDYLDRRGQFDTAGVRDIKYLDYKLDKLENKIDKIQDFLGRTGAKPGDFDWPGPNGKSWKDGK